MAGLGAVVTRGSTESELLDSYGGQVAQLSVAPPWQSLVDILYFFPLVFWIWMLWAGVLLWRSAPARARERQPRRNRACARFRGLSGRRT